MMGIRTVKFLRNSNGTSLVQIMIALSLTGVLSVILMNLAEQQNKQQKTAVVNSESIEIFTAFNSMIAYKDSCEATFIGLPKGRDLSEFRYNFDPNKDPYATVGEPFRGTKLILRGIRILTDAEVTATNKLTVVTKDATGKTVIVVRLTLERPKGVIGAQNLVKYIEVPVSMGQGQIVTSPVSASDAVQTCLDQTSNDGCIANVDTGVCNADPTKWKDDVDSQPPIYIGYCINLNPPTQTDDVIIQCLTSK